MKISGEEFKELERWIVIRDYSLRARQLVHNFSNVHEDFLHIYIQRFAEWWLFCSSG